MCEKNSARTSTDPLPPLRSTVPVWRVWSALAFTSFTLLAGCNQTSVPQQLRTAAVEKRSIKASVEATGRLRALDPVDVVPAVSGVVVEVFVAPGDRVAEGQPLGLLDSEVAKNRVNMQRAALAASQGQERLASLAVQSCRRKLNRSERLAKRGQLSGAELEDIRHRCLEARTKLTIAEAERERAAASLAVFERDVELSTIRSPRAGVVLTAPSRLGAWTSPKSPLFRIGAPLDVLRLEAQVAEVDIHRLRLGQACSFEVEAFPGRQFSAEITNLGISAHAEQGSVTYAVQLRAGNPHGDLRPGMSARVRFVVADVREVLVAREAALRFVPKGANEAPPRSRVFKQVGVNQLEAIPVDVGISDGKFVELRSPRGLEVGDTLAIGYLNAGGPVGPAITISGP